MIIGVGVDIVELGRIERSYSRFGDRFARRILTDAERQVLQKTKHKVAYLAKRFAAKEAVSKALGSGMRRGVSFLGIEVLNDASGAPGIALLGKTKHYADTIQVNRIHISLSDERLAAVAFAVAEGASVNP